jgi:penicillin amidase
MIFDNTSSVAPAVVASLILNIDFNTLSQNEKEAFTILKKWKGSNNLDDVAPTIYNKWIFNYLKNTFEDELGASNFKQFLGTHVMKQMIAKQVKNEKSLWWDNINTKNHQETRSEIVSQSFKESILALEIQLGNSVSEWTWNKVHTLEHEHPLGKISILRTVFNVGPFEVSGSTEVINNLFFDYTATGQYQVKGGPSTRRIIDFSDIENSWSILPTGQSGNPFSAHYKDQAELYNSGKFRRMKLNEKEIVRTSTKLVFIPHKK